MTKITIEPCISKKDFIENYSQETYDSIIKVDEGKVLGEYHWAKNYVSTTKGLIDKESKEEENILVLSRSFYIDSMFNRIKSEIYHLQELSKVDLTPKFRLCFYEFIEKIPKKCVYTIILENHNGGQGKEKNLEVFQGFKPHVQVYKVLQMAMLILDLHKLGITHQSIMPESFVSTDAEMSDFRLVNFRYSKKLGEEGAGGSKIFASLDKFGSKYVANFHHDAHAFGVTIMYLFDEIKVFENEIKEVCFKKPEDSKKEISEYLTEYMLTTESVGKSEEKSGEMPEEQSGETPENKTEEKSKDALTDDCKKVYSNIGLKINAKVRISFILLYLQERFFNNDQPLTMKGIIETLLKVSKDMVILDNLTGPDLSKEIEEIEKVFKEKIEAIDKLSTPTKDRIILI